MIKDPVFKKINEAFTCIQCYQEVPKAQSTCRDHCPCCLYSVHVDHNPGDRSATCLGRLQPVSYSLQNKKGFMIHYVCLGCGMKKRNKFLEFDGFLKDDFEALLKLPCVDIKL